MRSYLHDSSCGFPCACVARVCVCGGVPRQLLYVGEEDGPEVDLSHSFYWAYLFLQPMVSRRFHQRVQCLRERWVYSVVNHPFACNHWS